MYVSSGLFPHSTPALESHCSGAESPWGLGMWEFNSHLPKLPEAGEAESHLEGSLFSQCALSLSLVYLFLNCPQGKVQLALLVP